MKKGVLVAILVLFIFIIFLVLTLGFLYLQFTGEPAIPGKAMLTINISGDIVESNDTFLAKQYSVRELWYHIRRAKIDKRINGIILKISYLDTGLAKIEDIGGMIRDFRKSGKKVIAFIQGGGLREYLLASFADKVIVFKGESLIMNGLAAEILFLKETLAKLGIKAEFYHVGQYKTAANTFTQDGLTPAHRESLQTLIDDIFDATIDTIAANRGVAREIIRKSIADLHLDCGTYLETGMIDQLAYEDEILAEYEKDYKIVDFDVYKETTSPLPYTGINKVAVIFAAGEIRSGQSGTDSFLGGKVIGSDTLVEQLRLVRQNPAIKAVVLRVDSGGGSVFASQIIDREVALTNKEKPIVISMSDLAASGGYYISLAASKIFAQPQTITGSIGVLGGKFVVKDLYDKVGIKKATLKTTQYADWFSDYREFTAEERNKYTGFMKQIYDDFKALVAQYRPMELDKVEEIAQGRVWAGKTALQYNMVDQFGGLVEAVEEAKKLAGIPSTQDIGIKIYPKEKTLLEMIQDFAGLKAAMENPAQRIAAQLQMYQRFFPALLLPYRLEIK